MKQTYSRAVCPFQKADEGSRGTRRLEIRLGTLSPQMSYAVDQRDPSLLRQYLTLNDPVGKISRIPIHLLWSALVVRRECQQFDVS